MLLVRNTLANSHDFFQISALWDYFCFNINGVRPVQCRGALSILCMAAKSSPSILGSHLQDIVDIGFGRWAKEEPLLARTACLALHRLSEEDKVKLLSTSTRVFAALQSLITSFSLPEKIWYAATEKAISAIYTLHPAPEIFATEIAKKSLNSVFSSSAMDGMPNGVELETQNGSFVSSVSVTKLGRFLFVISHIALNHLVYIETSVKKIQKQKPKNDKSQHTNEDSEVDASKNSEVIFTWLHIFNHLNILDLTYYSFMLLELFIVYFVMLAGTRHKC
jgi:condensin complex subunit 1